MKSGLLLFALGLSTCLAGYAAEPADDLQEVIVTGTRTSGLAVMDSPAPVQILSAEALKAASGSPDLLSTLSQLVPSLTLQAFGYDMAEQTLLAKLRGPVFRQSGGEDLRTVLRLRVGRR